MGALHATHSLEVTRYVSSKNDPKQKETCAPEHTQPILGPAAICSDNFFYRARFFAGSTRDAFLRSGWAFIKEWGFEN